MNAAPRTARIALGFRFLGLSLLLLNPVMSSGFDDKTTHRDLTRVSIRASSLDQFLKTTLSLDQGINSPQSGATKSQGIMLWLEDGSELEDNPACRASNHFHNPLKEYGVAGVTDQPAFIRDPCAAAGFARNNQPYSYSTQRRYILQNSSRLRNYRKSIKRGK